MIFILVFLTSLAVVAFAIPPIITISFRKRLFDDPSEERKVHKRIIPNFGGVAIFSGFLFSCSLFIPFNLLPESNILMAGGLILFMIGLKDDLVGLSPLIKFIAQFTSAFIIAVVANVRIHDMNSLFGVREIESYYSIILTVIFIVGIVNAYNLIDGIDGLASSLGIVLTLIYAFLFFKADELGWAYLSLGLTGALIGFLFFNLTPAKIFMGDSGSLLLGFLASVLSIKFLNVYEAKHIMAGPFNISSGLSLVLSILIIPIFDTLRVFSLRILKRKSPFTADSNHVHHRLLFLGLSHIQSTLILVLVNLLMVFIVLFFQPLGETQLVIILATTVIGLNCMLTFIIFKYKKSLLTRMDAVELTPVKSFGERILEKISQD
ncbi:MraY family glycosyltransferase [Pedobacter antarcticus]|uniref:MraY family glycosyltransferase n=1 Tax=Pedobacter antarcticus TaxID=34086 RepID=UPI001C57A748|nr:MraY family glycosyltransferase [Pedobacter antarcticus]